VRNESERFLNTCVKNAQLKEEIIMKMRQCYELNDNETYCSEDNVNVASFQTNAAVCND
jgi:hypothetical protein